MTITNKYVSAIILLAIMIVPLVLFTYWQSKQFVVRSAMQEKLEQLHLQTIQIPASAVQWDKNHNEIIVEGKMFDVKYYTQQGDILFFTGLFDDQESVIKKQVELLLQQEKDNGTTEEEVEIVPFFLISWKGRSCIELSSASLMHKLRHRASADADELPSVFLSKIYPPPKG